MFKRRWRICKETCGDKVTFTPEMKWPFLPWTDLLNGITEATISFETIEEAKEFINNMENTSNKNKIEYIYFLN